MMRILMIATCPFPAHQGTQVMIGQLADQLQHHGVDVELLTYGFGLGDIDAHDASVSYPIHRCPPVPGHRRIAAGPSWGRPVADAMLIMRGAALIRKHRRDGKPFDLIHGHNYEGALVGAVLARTSGLPLLYHAHNLMGDELETYFKEPLAARLARMAGQVLDRTVPALADGCVAVSAHTYQRLAEKLTGDQLLHYHPPAVDYGPRARGEQSTDLVYLGNLDGYQNVEVMLDALVRVPGATCTIVTPDPAHVWRPMLEQSALQDRVTVVAHGSFEEVKPMLEGALVALLPRTIPSGFPIKLLNYLAAGRPVVACHGGAQGLGLEQGVWVVDNQDSNAMAGAIRQLLKDRDLREELGERALEAAREFTWPIQIKRLEQVYTALLRRKQFRRVGSVHTWLNRSQGRDPLSEGV